MAIAMLALHFLVAFSNKFLGKKLQLGFQFDAPRFVYLNLLNALLATCFYLCSIGGRLIFNTHMVICSAAYALLCFTSVIHGVVVYKYITIPLFSVMSISGSMLGSAFFGYVVLKEEFRILRVLAMLIVIISVIIPMKEILSGKYKLHKKGFVFCVTSFVISAAGSVGGSLYLAFSDMVPKPYYALTNVFLVLLSLIILSCFLFLGRIRVRELAKLFCVGQLGIIAGQAGLNFSSALIGIVLRTLLPVSMLSIINSALGMIATVAVSLLCFREKLSRAQVCSFVLLLIATALCAV